MSSAAKPRRASPPISLCGGLRDRRNHDLSDPNWDVPGEELDVDAVEERTVYALRKRFRAAS
jgi:hypothetical protein